ncbi:TetR family transcriptional regulator [Mycolicibacterium moriokaense]|jgi:AcrR family transcriptional regulator|uniref:Transcriptional regulator n=1 Tax=Mycolicibacterium moriokaense TaxID=39691 RepID=A0AAD1HG17_9MYCO|nr:helix-turn-helix domain-containing protein [Mycolicibacterium moriokaense]MCV7038799.1 helix-turn-helix transcriptional regulator [Mycolicibacterium moriokaense]ORB25397.1 TetR family transcriptional regulator [Mycolicibacterium moriokaense]BBX03591.1 transcriptional regulator [Mycolicibacterium moriokaense]
MARSDWLIGGDRRTAATERIYDAAMDLIARNGMDAFDVDALAARVHCSRATVYRHAGGKAEIRDAVLMRSAARIVATVRDAVDGLSGAERIGRAITVALKEIRSHPLRQSLVNSLRSGQAMTWITESPVVAGFATDLNGLTEDDTEAAQWIVRVVMSMLYWPVDDADAERRVVERFVLPAFAELGGDRISSQP